MLSLRRMSSKLISTGFREGCFCSEEDSGGFPAAGSGFGSGDEGIVRGDSSRNRSRNWFSRKVGTLGTRSTLATECDSVRWPVSKRMKVPSGLHDTVLLASFARKLTCLPSPPVEGTTPIFLNIRPEALTYASHLPSGDQSIGRV